MRAIAVSMAFEGYRPGVLSWLAGVLAVVGNVWMPSRGGGGGAWRLS